jgi:hypothetical protein
MNPARALLGASQASRQAAGQGAMQLPIRGFGAFQPRMPQASQQTAGQGRGFGFGFIPPEARVAQPGSSDFKDVLRSMGYAQGFRGIRRPDGSFKIFNPVRLGEPDTEYENYTRGAPSIAELRAANPDKYRPIAQASYISPEMQKMIDSEKTFKIGNRDFRYDRRGRPVELNPDLANTDMRGFMMDSEGRKTFFSDPTKKTKQQEFNLQNFQQARPGVKFANNAGFNVTQRSGLFGESAFTPIPKVFGS